MEELDKRITEIVRSTVEGFVESLLKGEIQAFLENKEGQRNGSYERIWEQDTGRLLISECQEIETMSSRQLYSRNIRGTSAFKILWFQCTPREYQQER